MPNRPRTPASEIKGDFAQFTEFMRHLVAIPYSEIKAAETAEKESIPVTNKRIKSPE